MRMIGLIGGMSWESSAEYYRIINQEVRSRMGSLRSARLLMYSVDFGPIERAQHLGRWDLATEILRDAARSLRAGGAQCIVLCTNTMHRVADDIQDAGGIPMIHIADPIGRAARRDGYRTVGLIGTQFTMEQAFLKDRLSQLHNLEVLLPSPSEQREIHRIIYDELCAGVVTDESRKRYVEVIEDLGRRGAEAIILACTEIMLLIKQEDSALPLLDTTVLHARAAVDFALEEAPI